MIGKEKSDIIISVSGTDPSKCMQCGKCTATCPAGADMDIYPHRFVALVSKNKINMLLESKSLWSCLSCFACVQRCPRGVEPASIIESVRLNVIRKKGKNRIEAGHIQEITDSKMPQQAIVSAFRKYSK